MKILAIDPGPEQSAWLVLENEKPKKFGICDNVTLLQLLELSKIPDCLVIEMVSSYGMPVGKDVFETCVWIGRFFQAVKGKCKLIYRKNVKLHLCGSMRAKDSNIRQAILDRYPRTGGGKVPQVGTKKQPGPLYGIIKDIWQALAVAITYKEQFENLRGK